MDDKTLVERVIAWLDGGCSSWNVPSSDIRQMATRIEALEAALRNAPELHEYGSKQEIAELKGVGRSFVDAWRNWLITARKTLEGSANG